ncbi:unnamed protein product [Clonostachys solani]|uniref:Uncharacterized protein n=1 Tax=Clonostachys solani TaxID=160281 RepID=A0A9N9W0S5_9HYPO|nr:unnamed protein product [Clonostachys solani]
MAASTHGHPAIPVELWVAVAAHVIEFADLAALARTSSPLHNAVIPVLYARALSSLRSERALFWGVLNGFPRTVEAALDAGIDVNLTWHSLLRASRLESVFSNPEGADVKGFLDAVDRRGAAKPGEPKWHWSALHLAAMKGKAEIVELLLQRNAKMSTGSLGLCACEMRPRTVGERPRHSEEHPPALWTPYHVAVCAGQVPAANLLISNGASVNMETPPQEIFDWEPTMMTALHVASKSGNEDMLNWLLSKGHTEGGVESVDSLGQTPLVYAYLYQNWGCFDILLQNGANKNKVVSFNLAEDRDDWRNVTMLYDALASFRFKDALRLVEFGVDLVKPADEVGALPLIHLLCKKPWIASLVNNPSQDSQEDLVRSGEVLLQEVLNRGMDPNESYLGYTALAYAAGACNTFAVQCLLHAGAHINGNPGDMFSPLATACQNQWRRPMLETVSLLIESGASVNPIGDTAVAPTWTLSGHYNNPTEKNKVLELLLDHGARIARGTSSGQRSFVTPLDEALRSRDMEGFERLLSRCKPEEIGDDDIVGFWDAIPSGGDADHFRRVLDLDKNRAIVRDLPMALSMLFHLKPIPNDLLVRLLEMGANPNTAFGMSNLIDAIMSEQDTSAVVKTLLAHGANPNTKWNSDTPLTHLLVHSNQPLEAKLSHVGCLLDAGVSIYERLDRSPSIGVLSERAPATHLALAIQNMNKSPGLVELMLERQPFRDHLQVRPYEYIYQAFGLGNGRALKAIIRTCDDATSLIRENAHELMHRLLDQLCVYQFSVEDMMTTAVCLRVLIEESELDLFLNAPEQSNDNRTAREKLLSAMRIHDTWGTQKGMGMCLGARIQFSEEDTTPTFLEPGALVFDNSTPLSVLGKLSEEQ